MSLIHPNQTHRVLGEVLEERARQDAKWGQQDLPDGTGDARDMLLLEVYREQCEAATADGTLTNAQVMREEYAEVLTEVKPDRLRKELIQLAAVCVKWVEQIDRRHISSNTEEQK